MKQLLIVLAVVFGAGVTAAYAQDAGKASMAKRMTDSMRVHLQLTEDQVPKVLAINETFAGKAAAIKSEGGSRLSKGKKLKAANSERDIALKAVLTEAQFKAYKANKKENKGEFRQRMRERKRGV